MGTEVLARDVASWAALQNRSRRWRTARGEFTVHAGRAVQALTVPFDSDNDLRQAMVRALPRAAQPFLSWLTAKPLDGERHCERTPIYHVWTAFLWLAAGVAGSVAALILGGWWFVAVPFALCATTAGLGKLQAVVYHHCAHDSVFRYRPLNAWMGEFVSILLLIKRHATYRREHLRHHFAKVLLTEEDEFLQFLRDRLGMRPGMPKSVLRRKVVLRMASPVFYAVCLWGRARSCFLSDSRALNLIGAATWAAALAGAAYFGVVWQFAVVWLVPVVVLFQAATMFRILCEHRFPAPERIGVRDARFICESTAGVFPAAVPPTGRRGPSGWLAWAAWWAEMLAIHLPCRVLVLVGDAPAHDFHHRNPSSRRWANYIHERHSDARSGCTEYPDNYREYWGLFRAVDDMLETLSRLPADYDAAPAPLSRRAA